MSGKAGGDSKPQTDAKRMDSKALDQAARNNDYRDAHDLKRDFGLDKGFDIFLDKQGDLYSGLTQSYKGEITLEPLGINVKGY